MVTSKSARVTETGSATVQPCVPNRYKQTDVGVIPEDWGVQSMAELFTFQNGVNADKSAYGSGIPFINVLEVITYPTLTEDRIPGRVSLSAHAKSTFAVQRGDVLFNRTSETQEEVGLTSVYDGSSTVVFGGFVIRARPRDTRMTPTFAAHALRSPSIRTQIVARGQGAIRANIGQRDLSRVQVYLPSKAEQEAIAEALNDADALIKSLEHLIAKKRQIKLGAMQELLTGKKRLPGFEIEPGYKQTDVGMIPKDWDVVDAGSIGRFKGGSGFPVACQGVSSGDYPFFKVSDMNNEGNETLMETANNYISEVTRRRLGATAFPPHTIVFAKVGAAVFLERKKLLIKPSCLDNNMAGYVLSDTRAHHRYIQLFLLTFRLGSLVSTTALPSLSGSVLNSIKIPLPPTKAEQVGIAAILSDMDAEVAALETKLAKARHIKQGMMQELLTGKTRLI